MKNTFQKNRILWISLAGNLILLALVIYFGCQKKAPKPSDDPTQRGDYYCIRGWTNTLEKLHLDVDVVFFGASMIRGSSFEEYFPDVSICNLGYAGDQTKYMYLRTGQIKAVNPEKVFVQAGFNGHINQTDQEFSDNYAMMVDSIRFAVPDAEIYLQSLLPVNPSMKSGKVTNNEKISNCNRLIRNIAEQKELTYIDLYSLYEVDGVMPEDLSPDGVHLYPEAYSIWAEAIRKYIE